MRTLDEVAVRPQAGDKVIMRTGHVRYEVLEMLGDGSLWVTRTNIRTGPYSGGKDGPEMAQQLGLCGPVWWDLVTYGASALE